MIFFDASAIVGILADETDAGSLTVRLQTDESVIKSPLAVYEATLGLARITGAALPRVESTIDAFLTDAGVHITPITAEMGRVARHAFERFGKGRHPAGLNMGDCFAYACASVLGARLLFKGNDFSRTDIPAA